MNLNNLVKYCAAIGLPDPLSGISVPEPINKDLVRSAIMVRCGLLTPVYAEPAVFTEIVADWFQEKQWTFEHLINIIKAEYSPIENVDEYSDYIDSRKTNDDFTATETRDRTGQSNTNERSNSKKVGNSGEENSGSDITENEVSAENASTYQPDNKSTVTYGKQTDQNYSETTDGTADGERKDSENEKIVKSNAGTGSDDLHHIGRRHGNVGVTSNQQLITSELELLRHFDIYRYIAEIFEADNMLLIY